MAELGARMTANERIKTILSESVSHAQGRETRAFSLQLENSNGSVVLFGAGALGRLCHGALRCAGIPIKAFCDKRADNSTLIDGTMVLTPPDAAERFGQDSLFVVAIWTGTAAESMSSRIDYLRRLGCRHVVPFSALMWSHGQASLPVHSFSLPSRLLVAAPDIFAIAERFIDELSLRRFADELTRRIRGEFPAHTPDPHQYFPEFIALSEREIVADGGAYNGDTLRAFLERTHYQFSAYYAFEPDRKSSSEMARDISRLPKELSSRIFLMNTALSDQAGVLNFLAEGTVTSRVSAVGSDCVATMKLDQVSPERPFSFVKLDVEGCELRSLRGAAVTLRVAQPTVAACVYHAPMDFIEIPKLLIKTLPNHRFYFRGHGYDGWESVFYAVRNIGS